MLLPFFMYFVIVIFVNFQRVTLENKSVNLEKVVKEI